MAKKGFRPAPEYFEQESTIQQPSYSTSNKKPIPNPEEFEDSSSSQKIKEKKKRDHDHGNNPSRQEIEKKRDQATPAIRPWQKEKCLTWAYVGGLVLVIIFCIAPLAVKNWCTLQYFDIGLTTISVSYAGDVYSTNLFDLVKDCPNTTAPLSGCIKFDIYYAAGIIMCVLSSFSITASAATLGLIIWMQCKDSFRHWKILARVAITAPILWTIGVAVMIMGFGALKSNAPDLVMSTGYGLALVALVLHIANAAFARWKLPKVTNRSQVLPQ